MVCCLFQHFQKIKNLEFRVVFNDTSTALYRKMINIIQDKIKPMIVSSMLDHDSLHGNASGKSIEVREVILLNQLISIKLFIQQKRHFRIRVHHIAYRFCSSFLFFWFTHYIYTTHTHHYTHSLILTNSLFHH